MLYNKYVKMHIKSLMQYKANMTMLTASTTLVSIGELFAIFILFQNFNSVGSWGFYETALMFGIVTASYSFVECFARGFDEFSYLIKNGDLDRILVRPVGVIKQIFGTKIEFSKMLKVFLGIAVAVIAILNLNITWTLAKVIVLILAFVCACCIVWGVMLVGAGISVFTVEGLEFVNIFTNGAKEIAYYPINIYDKWLTNIFTFVIPVACFNYLPISFLMGYGGVPQIVCALSPLIGVIFLIPCLIFFNIALKKYQSTGT